MITTSESLEKETKHLWWLGRGLADAIKKGNAALADEFGEDLAIMAEISEHPSLRAAARCTLNKSRLVGAGELVAFEVAKAVVAGTAEPEVAPARPTIPAVVLSLLLLVTVSAAASPAPPSEPTFSIAAYDDVDYNTPDEPCAL